MTRCGHKNLRVWQRSMDLAHSVYCATGGFPREELYGLVSQMRRSAVSIPSNLAEGYGRGGNDYARFVTIAYGSLLELETQTALAARLGFLSGEQQDSLLGATAEIGRMLNRLRTSLSTPQTLNPAP